MLGRNGKCTLDDKGLLSSAAAALLGLRVQL